MKIERRRELLADAKDFIKRSVSSDFGMVPGWAQAQMDAVDEAIAAPDLNLIFANPAMMTSAIGMLPVNSTGLRAAVDEIDRLNTIIAIQMKAIELLLSM